MNTKPNRDITAILKKRCSYGRECAEWHGICPDSVEEALTTQRESLDAEWEKRCLEVIDTPLWTGDGIEGVDEIIPDGIQEAFVRQTQRTRLQELMGK